MYVIREDAKILNSDEVGKLLKEYYEKFGEQFVRFNYTDFKWDGDTPAAVAYLEALREAVKKDTPTHFSKNPYEFFGH